MAFVQKYEKGKTLINELKDSAKEYVVENVNEATNPLKSTSENVPDKVNTSNTPIIKPTVNTKAGDKITINGIDINKKLLIDNLKKKSFSATGLNRVVWDKILGKIENLSEYNSSNPLDVDYGSDLKYDIKDLENRGNLILAEILKEASSNTYAYEEKEEEPFTFTRFLGTELGLEKDYDYVNDYERLKSFEEDQYEPEYTTNKKTGLEEIVKNKYTTNLSTLKRSELISKYLDKEIENVNNSSEDTKYLHNTIDKTEYLNRLNEAKIALDQLKRTKTIKNAAPEFYRIGIDVNKLFNAQQNNNTPSKETTNADGSKTVSTPNTDGSRTDITTYPDGSQITKKYDKNGNEVKEDNTKKEEEVKEEVKEEVTPVTNSSLFAIKPQGLPEHFTHTNYSKYLEESQENPYIPLSQQWNNWFANKLSNPYDPDTQKESWNEWEKYYKNRNLKYRFIGAPKDLLDIIKSNKEITDFREYITTSKTNPYKEGTESYIGWNKNKNFNPYSTKSKAWKLWNMIYNPSTSNKFISTLNDLLSEKNFTNPLFSSAGNKHLTSKEIYDQLNKLKLLSKNITFDEFNQNLQKYLKANPRKGQLGLKFQPYSILDSNYKQLFENIKIGDFNTYYNNKKINQNKGKINILDNFMFPTDINKSTTENKSIIENKNSIKHIPEEEKIKETITNKKGIGSSTITGIGDVLSNLAALKINKNIADNYKNSLQAPTITSTQYVTPKVYQDSSRLNDFAALRNSSIPKTSDINIYQNSQRDFNKQLGEYLFKEQTQQATGIRQDKEKLNAVQNAQLEENTKVANANEAAKIALNNQKASIEASKQTKQGEISLDLLNKLSNFVAGYIEEKATGDQQIDYVNYNTELNNIADQKELIEKNTSLTFEQKIDELNKLKEKQQELHKNYMNLLKNKYTKYFPNWDVISKSSKTDVYK